MDPDPGHVPVMLEEVLEHLRPRPGDVVLDGTAGGGGHAAALIERIRPGGRLLLLDRDDEALARLNARFGRADDVSIQHANFCDFREAMDEAGLDRLDAALLDLGLSSPQLASDRGFSFAERAPLDMRFDRRQDRTASDVVNHWPERDLADLFSEYGDQPFARRIARAIVERRPMRWTDELAEVVARAQPPWYRRKKRVHPATRVFQALRMAVNDEPGSLERFLDRIFENLTAGGRVAIIAFHSGEDRVVKVAFRDAARAGEVTLPFKKPWTPTPEETRANPRSRSAKLRVAERLGPADGSA